MDSKSKKAELDALRQAATAKLAEVKPEATTEEVRAIEASHAEIVAKVLVAEKELRALETAERKEARTAEKVAARKAAARKDKDKTDDDEDKDDDDEDDDDDDERCDEEGDDKKRSLKPSQVIEMSQFVVEARKLGVELDMSAFIKKGQSVAAMRTAVFAELAKKSDEKGPKSSINGGASVDVINDERADRNDAMEIALIQRVLNSGGHGSRVEYKPKDKIEAARVEKHRKHAETYLGRGLVDIAAECVDYRPRHSSRYLTAADSNLIFERAFQSTSDFPNIFMNVLNKSLLARYELHMPTYRQLAVERPFADFRPHPQIRAGEFPVLQPVSETGELKYGASVDSGEYISVSPYGVIFTISRQMLVNDDLGAIDQILGSAGDTVLIFENTTFFTMLQLNSGVGPVLNQDGLNVFNATSVASGGHGNYLASGSGAVPGISTIGTARQALRQMKSLSGNFLNVGPSLILSGPATETVADQMVTAITPTLTTSVNPFSGRLRSVSDANITGTQWYLFSEPSRVPNFIYGFLNGANGPRVRTFEPFGVQGVKISLEHDFGVGAVDFRGAYLNYGA
jgi:hypothetical protein